MTLRIRALLIPALLGLSGCGMLGGGKVESASNPAPPSDWRSLITNADRERLARWRIAWIAATDKVTKAGSGAKLAEQGPLLKPDSAVSDPAPPEGDYRCRVFKMGAQLQAMPDFVAYPAFTCRIVHEGPLLRFAKIDGSQRPMGTIYADDGRRMVFLGSMVLGDEPRPLQYGRDPERDMVGIVERVEGRRWRIAFPYPRWESTIDILELLPKE